MDLCVEPQPSFWVPLPVSFHRGPAFQRLIVVKYNLFSNPFRPHLILLLYFIYFFYKVTEAF